MNQLMPGKYTARAVEYGIPEVEGDKHPQVAVVFEFMFEDKPRRMTYYGSLHPNAIEHTSKAMIVLGMKSNDWASLLGPDAIDMEKEVSITIENHTYKDKTSLRISWVNEIGGGLGKSMDPRMAKARLSSLNGALVAARQKTGAPKPAASQPRQQQAPMTPEEEPEWMRDLNGMDLSGGVQ